MQIDVNPFGTFAESKDWLLQDSLVFSSLEEETVISSEDNI
jgi:hypothetical protein